MVFRKIFFLIFFVPVFLNSAISFKEPSLLPIVFEVGRNPRGIASDDFNGDGKFDIAVTGEEIDKDIPNKGYLYVFLGDGDFGFQAPISYKLPTTPAIGYGYGITTGDFDKDGRIDIFVASVELKQVLFFKGIGDGTFRDPVGTNLNYRPEGLQREDLNNDGNLDLITCNNQDNNISILLGSGDGSFYQITNHSTNSGPSDCAIGDLNGDGFQDIVVATSTNPSLNVFLNGGTGNFPSSSTQYDTRIQAIGLSLADFNEDGYLDVVMLGRGGFTDHPGTIGFVKGLGNGTFEVPVPSGNYQWIGIEDYLGHKFSPFEIIDLNGDGHNDIIGTYPTTNEKNYVFVGLGKGNGTFDLFNFIASPGDGSTANLQPDQIHSISSITKDFNLDGILDIAVTTGQSPSGRGGGISIIKGNNQGLFYSPRSFPGGRSRSATGKGTTTGDFDDDGKTDIVSLTNRIDFLKGLGDGTFQEGQLAFSGYETGYSLTKADFDKDGKQDLVWGQAYVWNQPLTLYVIYGNGNGTFTAGNKIQWGSNGQTVENVLVADFNNDSYPDIACFSHTSDSFPNIIANLDVFLYDPSNPRNFIHSDSSPNLNIGTTRGSAFAIGDVDNDGKVDLIGLGIGPNRILFFKGLGDGTFNSGINAGSTGAEPYWDSILKDINKDGKLDLIIGTYDNLYINIGNGDGTFGTYSTVPNPASISQIASEDLDGDGNPDIATAHGSTAGSDGFSVLKGKGDGTFETLQRFSVGNRRAHSLNISDFNLDGKPDIVVEHDGSNYNHFTVLLNDSGPRADLSVTKTRISGEEESLINYLISVTNNGPDEAANVQIKDFIRQGAIYLSSIPSQGSCSFDFPVFSCNLGTILPGNTASVTLKIQSISEKDIQNTVSTNSSTGDSNNSNNGAIGSPGTPAPISIIGPERLEVGRTYDYAVRYVNSEGITVNNAVVVVTLPTRVWLEDVGNNGIYYPEKHQIFWKLGNLPPWSSGLLPFSLRVLWGTPAHTPYSIGAVWGGSNLPGTPFNINEYLTYQPVYLIDYKRLTAGEVSDLLNTYPEASNVFNYAMQLGYSYAGDAFKRVWDNGYWDAVLIMGDFSGSSGIGIVFLVLNDTTAYLERFDINSYALYKSSGGLIEINGQLSGWVGSTPPSFIINPEIRGMCIKEWFHCLGDHLITHFFPFLLGQAIDSIPNIDLIKVGVGAIKCMISKDWQSNECKKMIEDFVGMMEEEIKDKILKKWYAKIPFLNVSMYIGEGVFYCDNNVWDNACTSDQNVCTPSDQYYYPQIPGNWKKPQWYVRNRKCINNCYLSLRGEVIQECNYYTDVNPPYRCDTSQGYCEFCLDGKCHCIDENGNDVHDPLNTRSFAARCGEFVTAHDPNEKEGPSGDVLIGETLNYKIYYENEGDGTAYNVFIIDYLDENLDEGTLSIQDGGIYYNTVRAIFWNIGDLPPGGSGSVSFSVSVNSQATEGEEILNYALVSFPSVPEVTKTNAIFSRVVQIKAIPQNLETFESTPLPILLAGADTNNSPLTYQILNDPSNGNITGIPPNIVYTPNEGFIGQDSFLFSVSNGLSESLPAKVTINVLSSPSDITPPNVTATYPIQGSSIEVYTSPFDQTHYYPIIKAFFSEPLLLTSLLPENVLVSDGINNFSIDLQFDGSLNALHIILKQPLEYGKTYTVTLLTGLMDLAGNPLSSPYNWSFYTYQNANLNANPPQLDFGALDLGQTLNKLLEIHNTGDSELNINSTLINGTNQNQFNISVDNCIGKSLFPDTFCLINIQFSPTSIGEKNATLDISTNAGNFSVPLLGIGGTCLPNLGDVNGNLSITSFDASIILQYVVGLINLTDSQKCRADVNENSSISAYDASLTLQCSVGLCSALPQNFKTSCINHGNCP